MAEDTEEGPLDGRAARWSGQRERRRAEFVDAAISAIKVYGPQVSTEQIAAFAGVARTRLYRHFDNADDLRHAVNIRISELIVGELAPALREPGGSVNQMIRNVVAPFVNWIAENANLYEYGIADRGPNSRYVDSDVRATIGMLLGKLVEAYLESWDVESPFVDVAAFSIIGMVESAGVRWARRPGSVGRAELIDQLSAWVWAIFDAYLRGQGVTLDPDEPLGLPRSWT
jgi:AcrR family transcriptional regulator